MTYLVFRNSLFKHYQIFSCSWYYLIKVCNDFIQQAQTFYSLVIHLGLGIEVSKSRNRSKHHTNSIIGLRV